MAWLRSLSEINSSYLPQMNPYEMGSWDPDLSAFTPVQYLGTTVNGGRPVNQSRCVEGFDQTSFLFGTSSNIFISCACPVSCGCPE